MEKTYTSKDYADKAVEANKLGQQLYICTHTIDVEVDVPDYDKDGNLVMIEVEEEITVIDYDEDCNPIGEHTEIIKKQVQKTHKETVQKDVEELIIAPYGYYICYKDNYTDGTINENFDAEQLAKAKDAKNTENVTKAKLAVENGYVTFKNAEFETNAQTVGDLTATMLLMQASGLVTYTWLSKDDKAVELTVEDFGTLGGLIAQFKNTVWNDKYLTYKDAIKKAKTVDKVNEIEIDYTVTAVD